MWHNVDVMAICMAAVWPMYGRCMAAVWPLYDRCMAAVWPLYGFIMSKWEFLRFQVIISQKLSYHISETISDTTELYFFQLIIIPYVECGLYIGQLTDPEQCWKLFCGTIFANFEDILMRWLPFEWFTTVFSLHLLQFWCYARNFN